MEEQAKTENRAGLLTAAAALLVLAVAWVDYATGEELSLSILDLAPICLSTWLTGRRWGLAIAIASAVAWLSADSAASHRQGHLFVPYWNAVVLLGFFWVAHEVKNPLMTLTMVADYLA